MKGTFFLETLFFIALPRFGVVYTLDVSCINTATCTEKWREGSKCVDGKCTNPFEQGCLRRVLGEKFKKRVCNSDDIEGAAESGICSTSDFSYPEIRVHSHNWDSGIFLSWILQILLSELVEVPVTLETGSRDIVSNFYDPQSTMGYSTKLYDFPALKRGNDVHDCRILKGKIPYTSCANIMPEVWDGQKENWKRAEYEGYIEPVEDNGQIGQFSWYTPRHVIQKYPNFASFYGLQGDENRQLIAKLFKRPVKWDDYCRKISKTQCKIPDDVATRPPETEKEKERFYAEGLYNGNFQSTDKNDCVKNPNNCTGFFLDQWCHASTYAQQQAHWLNISLETDGYSDGDGYPYGYSWDKTIEIYLAANATKSPIIIVWYTPERLVSHFEGTDMEFHPISLPPPTMGCVRNHVSEFERCHANPEVRLGSKLGVCDFPPQTEKKIIGMSLADTFSSDPEVLRSPGYSLLKNYRLNELQMGEMFKLWLDMGINQYSARETVCTWVAENLDDLTTFVPRGYPREIRRVNKEEEKIITNSVLSFAVLIMMVVIASWVLTYYWRKKKVIIYAQVKFLFVIITGLFLISVGAILHNVEPSTAVCTLTQWIILLGFSLELVPLTVKVAAINKLFQNGTRMKRVKIPQRNLLVAVVANVGMVLLFLILWTVVDPPRPKEILTLSGHTASSGGKLIERKISCSCSNEWMFSALSIQFLLLMPATVLAFQTRNIRQEFNESQRLGFMIYSHFMFMILRLIIIILPNTLEKDMSSSAISFLLSCDTLGTVLIYFAPKFIAAHRSQIDFHTESPPTALGMSRTVNL